MGVLECVKQVVFIVDTSSALSGIFDMLLTNYVVPCVEHFNGGPIDGIEVSQSPNNGNQYSLVTINPSPLFSVPSCDYWPITNSSKTLMQYFRNIKFEGGLIEHSCRISDGLAAALEFLDLMGKFAQKSENDVKFEKYCVLITNLPPSPMPVVESLKFGGMTYLQVAEHMAHNEVKLSIISPRWLSPYKELFLKGSPSVDISDADHGLHPGCMVLFHGLELTSIKSLKVKADPVVVTTTTTLPSVPESSLIPPSPSIPSTAPGSVGTIPQALTNNTPSPIQLTDLQASSLSIDKSPLTKTSSSSSLPTDTAHLWHHGGGSSPKVPSNPASVGSIPSSGLTAATATTQHEVVQSGLPPISHTPSPQSVVAAASPQRTTSLHQSTSSSSQSSSSSFPLQSSNTLNTNNATAATSFSGTLNLIPNDDLGTVSNPIQITSPSADGGLSFHPSSSHSGGAGLASLMSSSTALSSSSTMTSSLTSPPFTFSSSSHIDIPSTHDSTSVAPNSSISSLLMSNNTSSAAPISSSSAGMVRPPLAVSQSPTPPPPQATHSTSTTQPVQPPQGPAAIAAQILLQATQQANNSKQQQQMVVSGSSIPQPPGSVAAATASMASIPNTASNDGSGFMQQPSSSLTPTLNQPQPVNTGSIVPSQMNPLQQSLPPHPNQQPAPLQPMQQTPIWSGILETYEPRGNIARHPRPVQCNILISKPDIAQEIKPESWPSKLTMSTYSKNLFNTLNAFFRNNQDQLRTVHFQFLERPENVIMLRALMNNDLPHNKKIGIIQLTGSLPPCPIKAFFMIYQEKSQNKQFTGLIPLDQEKFISTLKHALAIQSGRPQAAQMQKAGLPSNLIGTNPMMTAQQQQQHMQQQQGGIGGGLSTSVGGNQQHMMGSTTMDNQNTFKTPNQGGGVGGVANSNMFNPGQQQNYPSMMGSQSTSVQQQQYSMTAGGGTQQQTMLQQQQIRSNLQMGSGQQQQMQQGQQPPPPLMGGQQQLGGQLGGQTPFPSSITPQQIKQALENATPEKRQMIYAKFEQQRAMRLQQQQQQYQQSQMYGGGGGMQQAQQQQPTGQQPMTRQPNQQQMTTGGGGGGGGMQQGMPPTQQQQPPPGSGGSNTAPAGGTGSTGQTMDFFSSF